MKVEYARRQQLAVSKIQELGWHFARMSPARPTRVLSLFGDDSIAHMDAAWTIHAAVDERALAHFAVLNHLRLITFVTAVPNAKIKKLQQVVLNCTINVELWDQLERSPFRIE